MRVELVKSFSFEAAHRLPNVAPDHKCRNLHGHSYGVDIELEGEVDPATGFLIDFGEIKAAMAPCLEELDHAILNEIPGLENPTSENLSRWIWDRVAPRLPQLAGVVVRETAGSLCRYRGR